jgi:hypothetical protein
VVAARRPDPGRVRLFYARRILAIGLPLASSSTSWDYIQAFVFGVAGTGSQYGAVLVLAPTGAAGARWIGLPYGVEAGVLGTVAMVAGFPLMFACLRVRVGAVSRVTSAA